MSFNTKVILLRCTERDKEERKQAREEESLELGKGKDSLGFLFWDNFHLPSW